MGADEDGGRWPGAAGQRYAGEGGAPTVPLEPREAPRQPRRSRLWALVALLALVVALLTVGRLADLRLWPSLHNPFAARTVDRSQPVLLRSGVPILEALEITSETVGNDVASRAIKDVQKGVKQGESIARPLEAHPVFPAMVVQMMAVGEETGALDEMLDKIADFYDQEVEATVDALTSLIEPLLIVVMGVCVGGMVISLYLPMFNIIKLIK